MLSDFLLILGVAALSLGLRSFRSKLTHRLGSLGIITTSFLIGWRFTGYWMVGVFCGASWFLLPWIEILLRARHVTLPLENEIRSKLPPNSEFFPALPEITGDIEEEGFVQIEDCGWDWEDYEQFARVFYHAAERCYAVISLVEEESISFFYVNITSRGKDGRIWVTWNYPFSTSLKIAPQWRVNVVRGEADFAHLYEKHRAFLAREGVKIDDLEPLDHELEPDKVYTDLQKDLSTQITHNIAAGILTDAGEGEVRYSWRGLFFLWIQFLRDALRLS